MLRSSSESQKIVNRVARSWASRKPNESMKLIVTTFVGVVFGFLIGVSFSTLSQIKLNLPSSLLHSLDFWNFEEHRSGLSTQAGLNPLDLKKNDTNSAGNRNLNDKSKIWVPTNPQGAERLPPKIVEAESDFYLHRLWGNPNEDLTSRPKYLVTFTVGFDQKKNIDAAVKKFSDNFTIVLFHYDGRTTGWDEFEWSKRAIHVSARKQAKWWYAKRFLHPDIVAAYDYIFIWDEDLGVEHFNAEEYLKLVRKNGLEISQPSVDPHNSPWQMTKRRCESEVHKVVEEKEGYCSDPLKPPCAGFVEIMAPVFSRDAWRCVWYLIQNDLVHGWGLDFAIHKCVEPAHKKMGVVDSQWIVHQKVPSLGNQGETQNGTAGWRAVRERCRQEWNILRNRMEEAEKTYFEALGISPNNSTAH